MSELQLQSPLDQIYFMAEHQADAVEATRLDMNNSGERYAVAGGAASVLPLHVWKLVRTDAFKQWYGDWERAAVDQFKTAHGSVYSYDEAGRTTRFKTIVSEQKAAQDITVFADLTRDEQRMFLPALHAEGGLRHGDAVLKVYVTEKMEDGTGKIIRTRDDVGDPNRLALTMLGGHRGGTFAAEDVAYAKRASLQPAEGLSVFDTRHFTESGVAMTERHLGNEVTQIDYVDAGTSQLLKKGEPLLLRDPRSDDEHDYCFVHMSNPMRMDRATYNQWSAEFGEGTEKRVGIAAALHQGSYDGLLIDGEPAPIFDDAQIMRFRV